MKLQLSTNHPVFPQSDQMLTEQSKASDFFNEVLGMVIENNDDLLLEEDGMEIMAQLVLAIDEFNANEENSMVNDDSKQMLAQIQENLLQFEQLNSESLQVDDFNSIVAQAKEILQMLATLPTNESPPTQLLDELEEMDDSLESKFAIFATSLTDLLGGERLEQENRAYLSERLKQMIYTPANVPHTEQTRVTDEAETSHSNKGEMKQQTKVQSRPIEFHLPPKQLQQKVVNTDKQELGEIKLPSTTLPKPEVLSIHLNEESSEEQQVRQLARKFVNMIQRSHFSQTDQTKRLTIRLYPEHLGSLRIELSQRDGMLVTRILAATSATKEMLDSQLIHLKQAFMQQNIPIDKIEINQGDLLHKFENDDSKREHEQQAKEEEQQETFDDEEKPGFSHVLNDVLFEREV